MRVKWHIAGSENQRSQRERRGLALGGAVDNGND